ncbi:ABC transporter substrate-binding protein [Rhodovulum viride]|uniref:ABC transporter substrate-binding protein n=1 Tax=Rhodovulum viride TaxID=1231134 RepID=A0ABX9DHP1_9RHOB|nr:extracellular solute-binding protein [Rhodovulum viride]RAP41897.1 ABC transporter substrate-binding protein [Rhodovulum viride]
MPTPRRHPHRAVLPVPARPSPRLAVRTLALMLALMLGAVPALAQDAPPSTPAADGTETVIKTHAFSELGQPKYPADFQRLDYVNPDAPKGGEISIWAPGTFDSFNPFTRKGRAGALATINIERLMTDVADEPGTSYGLIAESLEYPESEDWVIFNLRPEAHFTDGTPVTAEDVKFTFDLLMEQALPSYREAIKKLVYSPEVLDTYRIKFTFKPDVPRDGLISQMGSNPVMSKAWFEKTGARLDESSLTPIMGTGPYVLDSYDINRRIVYKRDPDYWGKDLPINIGRYNFDRKRVEYFADSIAALEGFKSGAYTFREEDSSKTWATGYDFPAVAEGWVKKDEPHDGNLPPDSGWIFNLARPQFQDLRVRRAIGLMYNFEWTNETLQFGLFKQRSSFWENSDLGAPDAPPEGRELELLQEVADHIDPAILTEPPMKAHTSGDRQLDRRNLRKASQLLDEAGWVAGDDGMRRNADGQMLRLEILDDSPVTERIALPFVDNLRALGVDASFSRVDPSQFTNRRRARDYDMILASYQTNLVPGLGMQQRFGSADAEYSLFNPAGFANEGADILMRHLVSAKSEDEFRAATRALDRIFRHAYFVVPTWYKDVHWVAYFDMYRHPDALPPYDLGYLDFWWYDADRAAELRAAGALR